MTDHLHDEIAALRAQLAKVTAERDMSSGPLNEAGRRAVTKYLRGAALYDWQEGHEESRDPCDGKNGTHDQLCELGYLLRLFGGAEELQRQVDASHKEALRLEKHRVQRLTPRLHEADWASSAGFTCKHCGEAMHLVGESEACLPWKGNWWEQ